MASIRLRTALWQMIILWFSLLILGGLSFFALRLEPVRTWMWQQTGEEEFLAQVKGLSDLASDWVRPPLQLAATTPVQYTDLPPYAVNTFLEQEADPAKVELAIQLAAAAGFHWIRQEFPWEDIEIHGKNDFEDRRHEPYRSAWEKYDRIVALAEANGMEVIARLSNPPEWTRQAGEAAGTFAPPDRVEE